MCRNSTGKGGTKSPLKPNVAVDLRVVRTLATILLGIVLSRTSFGQTLVPDWRRIGNSAIEVSLAALGSGPVERVWFSADGGKLYARTASGRAFVTEDRETWQPARDITPAVVQPARLSRRSVSPETGAKIVSAGGTGLAYAVGRAVYRTEDGGANWANLTEFKGASILGSDLRDIAVSPRDENEIVVAGRYGVWRSVDGGLSWNGLNDSLPNLQGRRLLQLPGNGQGARLVVEGLGEIEWAPGEKSAWPPPTPRRPSSMALPVPSTGTRRAGSSGPRLVSRHRPSVDHAPRTPKAARGLTVPLAGSTSRTGSFNCWPTASLVPSGDQRTPHV